MLTSPCLAIIQLQLERPKRVSQLGLVNTPPQCTCIVALIFQRASVWLPINDHHKVNHGKKASSHPRPCHRQQNWCRDPKGNSSNFSGSSGCDDGGGEQRQQRLYSPSHKTHKHNEKIVFDDGGWSFVSFSHTFLSHLVAQLICVPTSRSSQTQQSNYINHTTMRSASTTCVKTLL